MEALLQCRARLGGGVGIRRSLVALTPHHLDANSRTALHDVCRSVLPLGDGIELADQHDQLLAYAQEILKESRLMLFRPLKRPFLEGCGAGSLPGAVEVWPLSALSRSCG